MPEIASIQPRLDADCASLTLRAAEASVVQIRPLSNMGQRYCAGYAEFEVGVPQPTWGILTTQGVLTGLATR